MAEFIWKKSNYKLMTGTWKIGILLEAGYQIVSTIEDESSYIKIADQLYVQIMLLPYPDSQPLTEEEQAYFYNGFKLISKYLIGLLSDSSSFIIVLRCIQFSDCNIQKEAFTAAAIWWASQEFQFPMPQIDICFDTLRFPQGVYLFDFSNV